MVFSWFNLVLLSTVMVQYLDIVFFQNCAWRAVGVLFDSVFKSYRDAQYYLVG